MQLLSVKLQPAEGVNVILGQSHFIKTVEDLYEALVTSNPSIQFGIAFCEASGPALVRHDGNDKQLEDTACRWALEVGAGHFFALLLRNSFPINVLDRIKRVDEVVSIYCATANPVELILAETDQGRAILGVVDGIIAKGVETGEDKVARQSFLRNIGYKR